MRELGKFVFIIGIIMTLVGLVIWSGFAPKWLGRLPGDIRIEREHSAFYFPIVTCIILSIVLSLLLSIFRRRPLSNCHSITHSSSPRPTCRSSHALSALLADAINPGFGRGDSEQCHIDRPGTRPA